MKNVGWIKVIIFYYEALQVIYLLVNENKNYVEQKAIHQKFIIEYLIINIVTNLNLV